HRVVINLLENAVQYAGGEVVVEVELAADRQRVLLRILDRGPGIPAEQHERIFQPFFRLESSRNQRTGGSGLGLAIVKQLCDAQNWTISVAERSGGGAAFELGLPVAPAPGV
ncbi:MAG: ATP-binding protein, partial [Thioalkalivibrio sp.]|nr:ATP-binding protein [Thioalkalivibrio sp.]